MANISKITYKGVTYDIYDATAIHTAPTPYSLPVATYNVLGGVMPFYSNTNAATGVTAASGARTVAVNAISTTTGRYYAVEIDKDGRLYVNVPWAYQTHTGAIDETNGYKITLSGSSSEVTVPYFVAGTSGGLAKKPASGDTGKFLRGDNTWATPTDTNYTYSIGGAQDGTNGFKITLTGANGGSPSNTTVPRYAATFDGLVPLATTAQATDGNYFLDAAGQWNIVNKYHIWLLDSKANYGTILPPATGNWEATFPSGSRVIGNNLISCSGYAGTPKVGDMVITTGGFIGVISSYSTTTVSDCKATFVGRFDFMAYDHNGTLSAQNGTGYDSENFTLILGEY